MSINNNITFTARFHRTKDGLIVLMTSIVYNIMIMFVLTAGLQELQQQEYTIFPAIPEYLYKYKLLRVIITIIS